MNTITETPVRLFASASNWVEGEAVRQLYATARLDGMRAAFVTAETIYPRKLRR